VSGYLTLILCCQLGGEIIARLAGLPIPGPVIGMVILFCGLVVRGGTPKGLEDSAGLLLRNLPLLFVPAGVGVIAYMDLLRKSWAAITGAIIIGTVLTIAVTGLVMQLLNRQQAKIQKSGQP
jgi:holin-like protein